MIASVRSTPLESLHRDLGGKLVDFAGWLLPVQYSAGIIREHLHTRSAASLFDVSHMGDVEISGPEAERELEALLPVDLRGLAVDHQRYALLTLPGGGVLDDLMVLRRGDETFSLVVNASRREADMQWLQARLGESKIRLLEDRALLALQGPAAEAAVAALWPQLAKLRFMQGSALQWEGHELYATRSGYTGEDGFEISVPAAVADALARTLLENPGVEPAGLGARDSLRLEAGLCLYGHELDEEITPVEAGLRWSISPSRRPGAERAGGYPGAERIEKQLELGAEKARVGLRVEGRAPLRDGAILYVDDREVGTVTSGGYGPSLEAPVAMGRIDARHAAEGVSLEARQRGRSYRVSIAKLPFVAPGYRR